MAIRTPDPPRVRTSAGETARSLGDMSCTPSELALIDAYWRAANYLSVGKIYLLENPLLRVPLTREQINQLAQAAQNDPVVRPYRSFLNLSEGKVFCIMEAPSKDALAAWFQKMQMPCDYITPVELEGERGVVKEA